MKKFICIIVSAVLSVLVVAGCGNNEKTEKSETESNTQSSSQSQTSSSVQSNIEINSESSEKVSESVSENSDISIVSEDISQESSLPEGVTKTSTGSLKYTNSVLSLSVTFPSEFCIIDKSYTPVYGIYLQNIDGTATLQLESVEDKNVTANDLADYFKSEFPESEVYITDTKDIVCKRTSTDRNGNELMIFMKVRIKNGGYNDAALYCRTSDSKKFETLFSKINFS